MRKLIICIFLVFSHSATFAYATADEASAWLEELNRGGWTEHAAQMVIGANQEWLLKLATEQPRKAKKVIRDLVFLGRFPLWTNFLADHPESVILAINADNLELLYRVLSTAAKSKECWPLIIQQYAYLKAASDIGKLTRALENHSKRICQLTKAGVPGAGSVFLFDATRPGAEEYLRWLEQKLLEPALATTTPNQKGPSEALATAIIFAMTQGPLIRDRMARDSIFRQRFSALWDALSRATNDPANRSQRLLQVAMEPQIWDLLLLRQGETILKNWGPEIPLLLLFGPQAIPKDLHATVLDALFQGHTTIVALLQTHMGDQNLYNLMRRKDLSPYQMQQVLNALDGPCPGGCPGDYTSRLGYFRTLSVSAISSQFAPPATGLVAWIPYKSSFDTIAKITDGRKVSKVELGLLAFSVVTAIVNVGGASDLLLSNFGADAAAQHTAATAIASQKATTTLGVVLNSIGLNTATQHTATAVATNTGIQSLIPTWDKLHHGFSLLMPIAANTIGKKAGMMLAGRAIRTGAKMIPHPLVKIAAYAPEIWDSINAIAELTMQ